MTADVFIQAAEEIAVRLCDTALSVNDTVTWPVRESYTRGSDSTRTVPASGSLYSGTAGVGLFLAECASATGNQSVMATAIAALRHAVNWAEQLPPEAIGFHSGSTGVAYAAHAVGRLADSADFTDSTLRLVHRLRLDRLPSAGLDVIEGEAGAIPALLRLAEFDGLEECRAVAREMGERLLSSADRLPHGWTWGQMPNAIRPLTGYAHGASGFAHALLELAAISDDDRFLYAAVRALQYERHYYLVEKRNWPDFRNNELWELTRPERLPAFLRRVRAGESFVWPADQCMSAWCHGAPGIGLARLRAYELMSDAALRDECIAALRTTESTFMELHQNFSLCHGLGGNADTIVYAEALLPGEADDETMRSRFAAAVAHHRVTGTTWRSGTADGTWDPTLLLGEAGVGFALLRISGIRVPSILLVTPRQSQPISSSRYLELHTHPLFHEDMKRYGVSDVDVTAVAARPMSGASVYDLETPLLRSQLQRSVVGIEQSVEGDGSAALSIDDVRMDLLGDGMDWIADWLEGVCTLEPTERSISTARWQLTQRARIAQVPSPSIGENDSRLHNADTTVGEIQLVVRRGAATFTVPLTPLAHAVLDLLRHARTLDEIVGQFAAEHPQLGGDQRFRTSVLEQMRHAIRAGFVVPVWPTMIDADVRTV